MNNQQYDYPRRDREDIQAYLERIAEIIELGAFDTAIASAIFTLETIMPPIAEDSQLEYETKTPTELLQVFSQNNLISLESRDLLIRAIAIRDAFMSKQETKESDRALAQQVFTIIKNRMSDDFNDPLED
ncbi:MAG: hypothetical protein AB4290_10505 [Spirulina sp.]